MPGLYPFCAYLKYKRVASSKHGVHSPFVFDLVTKTFPADQTDYTAFSAELWRNECLSSSEEINVTDFGTGTSGKRRIADIAKRAAKSPAAAQLLHRIVKRFAPKNILELGTSLGISTNYMYAGNPSANIITLEGCPQTAAKAHSCFSKYHVNAKVVTGDFDTTLQTALDEIRSVDLVYIDGNHRKAPTLHYFSLLKKYSHNDSVLIFDDIHWSAEMEEAWSEIKSDPDIHVSIDVFHFGIVFFRKEQVKEDFVLKF
jgi:predicted O-methyltransferase YrrM